MIYLFVGAASPAKDEAIAKLKAKTFPSADTIRFDFDLIDGIKVDSSSLKQSLIALPAIAPKRMILVRDAQKLSNQNKELVAHFVKEKNEDADLVLDWNADEAPSGFVNSLGPKVVISKFASAKKYTAFDMTNLIPSQPAEALKILNELYEAGTHPLQVLGAIVWFWGKSKTRMSKENFTKGLKELQETDLNIKRSRLKAQYAVEVLVLKLCSLYA